VERQGMWAGHLCLALVSGGAWPMLIPFKAAAPITGEGRFYKANENQPVRGLFSGQRRAGESARRP
jgi:hypothetical protein